MIEKWKYLHFIIGPRGKIYIPAVIRKTQIRGRDQAGGVPFSSCSFFFLSLLYSFRRNASTLYNKDTAPSNGEQQSRRDGAAVEEEGAVQRGEG